MFTLLPLVLAVCGVLMVLALLALVAATPTATDAAARPWVRRTRLRSLLTLVAAAVVGGAALAVGAARPDWLGLPLALAIGLAAVAGLLVHAAIPYARPVHHGATAASLAPRGLLTATGRADRVVPPVLGAVTVLTLIGTGLTSSPDEFGRFTQVRLVSGPFEASHGPYPGWWYAPWMIGITLALVAAWALALARLNAAPAPPVPSLFDADAALRQAGSRVISRLTAAALAADLAGILSLAGLGQRSLVLTARLNGEVGHTAQLAVGTALLVVAGICALGAVVYAGLALGAATRLPVRVRSNEPVPT